MANELDAIILHGRVYQLIEIDHAWNEYINYRRRWMKCHRYEIRVSDWSTSYNATSWTAVCIVLDKNNENCSCQSHTINNTWFLVGKFSQLLMTKTAFWPGKQSQLFIIVVAAEVFFTLYSNPSIYRAPIYRVPWFNVPQ